MPDMLDRQPAITGYTVVVWLNTDVEGRLDVWPMFGARGDLAIVVYSRNGIPVSSWFSPLAPNAGSGAVELWQHYQAHRQPRRRYFTVNPAGGLEERGGT